MRVIKSTIEVLSPSEITMIHDSSLEILETIGLNVPCDEVLEICREKGALVDMEQQILRIPRVVMEDTLEKIRALNQKTFAAEAQRQAISAHISTQVMMTDYKTRTSRYGLRDDNRKGIVLLDAMKNFPSNSAVTVPSDVPDQLSDLICYADLYKYAKKEGGTYVLTPLSAKYIMELHKLCGRRGGYLLETISPLSYKKDTLEMALLFAKNGGGLGVGPMAMSGSTAPVTPAGTITLENAEILASFFIVFALTEQVAAYSAPVHSTDPKTMICSFGSPNQALYGIAHAQLMKHYGVHGMTNAGLTDALMPDFQCGIEKGLTAAFNFLAGAKSMGAQGIVGADQGNCFEQIVLDNEWVEYYNYIVNGFEVTPDTIALDVIREVGIKGNFLSEEHTAEYLRESFLPSRLFLRETWNNWVSGGSQLLDRAHEMVEEITVGYAQQQPVLSPSLCDEIDRIVQTAMQEIKHHG